MTENAHDDPTKKLLEIIAKYSSTADIRGDSRLIRDLGLDSFDLVNIAMEVEEALAITIAQDALPSFKTVDDVVEYARTSARRKSGEGTADA